MNDHRGLIPQSPDGSGGSMVEIAGSSDDHRRSFARPKAGEIVGVFGPSFDVAEAAAARSIAAPEPNDGTPWRHAKLKRETEYPDVTVRTILAQRMSHLQEEEVDAQLQRVINQASLGDVLESPISRLSRSMERRLSLALMIIARPETAVLEEPLRGVDHLLHEPTWALVEYLKDQQAGIVVVSEDFELADRCDQVVLVDQHRVLALGPPDAVRRQAFGGDVLLVEVPGLDRGLTNRILSLPYVTSGIRLRHWLLEIVVEDGFYSALQLEHDIQRNEYLPVTITPFRVPFDRVYRVLTT